MAINRNSEEGCGEGSSRVSFLNGFQIELSACSALAKYEGSIMKNQNLKDLKLLQRWKLLHHPQDH